MTDAVPQPQSDAQQSQSAAAAMLKAQKRRNIWLAWALVAFVVIVGVTTAIRIQQTDFSGGDRLYFSGYLDEAAKEERDREAIERARAAEAETQAASEAEVDDE